MYHKSLIFISALLAITSTSMAVPIEFEEVTSSAGFSRSGESWGISWGDLQGDGRPDLFVNNHRQKPSIYLNNGNGTFVDVADTVDVSGTFAANPSLDTHGAAWGDFDNDGDQDLFITGGPRTASKFFVNQGGLLEDKTAEYGFSRMPHHSGRHITWFDFNNDGFLDFLSEYNKSYADIFEQRNGSFVNTSTSYQSCYRNHWAQLADIDVDGNLDLICGGNVSSFPDRVYDYSTSPFTRLNTNTYANIIDSVVADFDGDLRTDIIAVRGARRISGAIQTSPNDIESQLIINGANEKTLSFVTEGIVTARIYWDRINRRDIKLGSSGIRVPTPDNIGELTIDLTLDPNDPDMQGIQPHNPRYDNAIYIGYDQGTKKWQVIVSAGNYSNYSNFLISSTLAISDVVMGGKIYGFENPLKPIVLMNQPQGLQDTTSTSGLNKNISCTSLVAGDFDNDMDVDLYVVCREGMANIANRLYDNDGTGTFTLVPGAGNAEGPIGFSYAQGAGTGENATLADYDSDGFLDLFVVNGSNMTPGEYGGPDQLFRNKGNGNHWIELDLEGTTSNREGVGAKVYVTTNGKTQLREQNGGYHRWSQNHQRLHFGLAGNTLVDIRVEWPSGTVNIFNGIDADKIYNVKEDGSITQLTFVDTTISPCGPTTYDTNVDNALFVWKDCISDSWHVRFTSGNTGWVKYASDILSDTGFASVLGYSLEGSDVVDNTTDSSRINYSFGVGGTGQDGIDFMLQSGATACFAVDSSSSIPVYLGAERILMTSSFDMTTYGACTNVLPTISINDISVAENDAGGNATFTLSLSAPSTQVVMVDVVTADGSAIDTEDYVPTSTTITFNPGETVKPVDVAILDDTLSEGNETFTVTMSNPVNAALDAVASGTATIVDDEVSACGAPVYDRATEQAVFVWKDCTDNSWHTHIASGGAAWGAYTGSVVASANFNSVTGYSIEASDTLDYTTDPARIDYTLFLGGTGVDGFDFTIPAGTNACFTLDAPGGIPVYIGADRTVMTTPFDLETLGACVN